MILSLLSQSHDMLGIPRESGDDPSSDGDTTGPVMYSPRERG